MSGSDKQNIHILSGINDIDENLTQLDETISREVNEEQAAPNQENSLITFIQNAIVFYQKFKVVLRKYWYVAALVFIVGFAFTTYYILNVKSNYIASLTFMLQEENEAGVGGAAAFSSADPLASFLLTRVTTQAVNIDRLRDISFSQKVITNMLFSKCIIGGKEDFLANHYLKIYYGYEDSYFKYFRGLNSLKRDEFMVFNQILINIRISNLGMEQTKSSAYILKINTIDEELSKVMCELFYQNLSNFYIDKTTEKAQRNYIYLRNRLDSVRNLMYSTEYDVANFEDRSHNLLLTTARVPQSRQYRNTEFYINIYGETLKSFEASKVALNNITPVFQVLDRPFYPLFAERSSRTIIAIIGVVATSFLALIVLLGFYFKYYLWPDYKAMIFKGKEADTEQNPTPENID